MKWLEPWWGIEEQSENFRDKFLSQLNKEVRPGHELFGLSTKLIARGDGDDCLFEILDGSGRVADVHLTWTDNKNEAYTYPMTTIYLSVDDWADKVMRPEHKEWSGE